MNVPAAAGSNVTVTGTDWSGVRVTPEPPLAVKPVPEADTFDIAKFALPVFFKTTCCEAGAPKVTLPKLTVEVLTEIWGADETPLPDKLTATVETSLLIEIFPEIVPAAAGLKDVVKVAVSPTPRVSGVGIPEASKAFPDTVTLAIVRLTLLVFERVMV